MDDQPALQNFGIDRILDLLPHRYPFLMVDRIINVDGDRSAIGIKNVTYHEPCFLGHFPGNPVFPGVLLIEGMAQTAGAICIANLGSRAPQLVYFMTIDNAKFRKPVVPGDTVEYHVVQAKRRKNIWKFNATAMVAGAKVAEAVVSALIADKGIVTDVE
jgi:3-hydroxyacyl-[acyl-carrier-protein] dehydratase